MTTPDGSGETGGSDMSGDRPPPEDFGARLSRARQKHAPKEVAPTSNLVGMAYRVVTELVAGILIGAGFGWVLDWWLGTSPWLLIVFFLLGTAAGFMNVLRAGKQLGASTTKTGAAPPAVRDDDDDDDAP